MSVTFGHILSEIRMYLVKIKCKQSKKRIMLYRSFELFVLIVIVFMLYAEAEVRAST